MKRGAFIEMVVGGTNGVSSLQQMIRRFLLAFAEYESKFIGARSRAAMLRHQASGRRMSAQAPDGWIVDPQDAALIVNDPEEQATIRRIVRLHEEG